jgi:hypothetical protein
MDGEALDSFTVRFTDDTISNYIPDTSSIPLWQIGRTYKPFFTSDTSGLTGMMTDTLNNYPVGANNWFVLKIVRGYCTLVGFWHRYQTTSGKDGGVVEYSVNYGATWDNVKDSCNTDDSSWGALEGIFTSNFYTATDTLNTGEKSFSGTSDTSIYSRFQFKDPPAAKLTAGYGCVWDVDTFYVRFRFISDTIPDTLAGWLIDSIKVKHFEMGHGSVRQLNGIAILNIIPNPSHTGLFTFPSLKNERKFSTEVFNAIGQRVYQSPYRHSLDLSTFPRGLYFYKVTDGTEYYRGRLLYE